MASLLGRKYSSGRGRSQTAPPRGGSARAGARAPALGAPLGSTAGPGPRVDIAVASDETGIGARGGSFRDRRLSAFFRGPFEKGAGGQGHAGPQELLDRLEQGLLLPIAEGDRAAARAGASGAADAVDIGLGHLGKLVVVYMADAVYVDPAGGEVGRDEDAEAAGAEAVHRPGPVVLALVRVDRLGGDAAGGQGARESVGAVLGAREHYRALVALGVDEGGQEGALLGFLDEGDFLLDEVDRRLLGRHRDPDGIAEDGIGQAGDVARHGGRKEEGLSVLGKKGDYPPYIPDEAHVEHAVRLVEDDHFDGIQADLTLVMEIEEATGRRGQDIDAAAKAP